MQLTLSQMSTPCLARFPPFCICLSCAMAPPLKANICRVWVRAVARQTIEGIGHTPIMIPYGSKASKGTPMVVDTPAVALQWWWCGRWWVRGLEMQQDVRIAPGLGRKSKEERALCQDRNLPNPLQGATQISSPTGISTQDTIILSVAQKHTFIRIANIATFGSGSSYEIARFHRRNVHLAPNSNNATAASTQGDRDCFGLSGTDITIFSHIIAQIDGFTGRSCEKSLRSSPTTRRTPLFMTAPTGCVSLARQM